MRQGVEGGAVGAPPTRRRVAAGFQGAAVGAEFQGDAGWGGIPGAHPLGRDSGVTRNPQNVTADGSMGNSPPYRLQNPHGRGG
jgi:hypothetical protein